MAETAILYQRDVARDATTYPELIDELKSDHITHKVIFETRIKQFEGFNKKYRNKIRTHTHINTDGTISQKNTHYGLEAYDVNIFGNFKDKSHITIMNRLAESHQTPNTYQDGKIGLYVIGSEFLNKDPQAGEGYTILAAETGRVAKMKEIWDFKIELRFGGTISAI